MTRCLHVINDLEPGGAATQLRLHVESALGRGEEVVVASLKRPDSVAERLERAGARVVWLRRRFWCDPIAAGRLTRLVGRWRPDALRSWDNASAVLCRLNVSRWSKLRWWLTLRGDQPPPWCVAAADGVLAVDEQAAAAAIERGADAARVRIVPNAYDPVIEPTTPEQQRAARGRLRLAGVDVSDQSPVVLCVTRLDDTAAAKEIAWASDLLRVVSPGLRLLIAGEGRGRLESERFSAAATEPGTVVWLGERLEVATLLAACDVAWCGRGTGAAPTPAVEAMAAGKPLVLADGPGRRGLLPHDASSERPDCLVRWNDRAGWARVTRRLLSDAGLASDLGGENAERVRSTHSIEQVGAALAGDLERTAQ